MGKGAFKITAIYVLCGVSWIVLSDKLLQLLQGHASISFILFIGSIKGFAYVVLTGFMLYGLIRRHGKKLMDSEKLYRSYFENNPTPMWIFDRDTFKFIEVNNATVESYGYSREEFKEMTVLDIRPDDEKPRLRTLIDSRWEIYKDLGIWTHRKKDGSLIHVQIHSNRFNSGSTEQIMVMARDVTGFKRLEDEKNEYLLRLEDTLNSINDAFVTIDQHWNILSVNTMFEKLSGRRKEELLNKKLIEVCPGIRDKDFIEQFSKALSEKVTVRFEAYSIYLKKWLRFSCYPTNNGIAAYFTDVTESKEKDLLLKKALERYDLAAMATGDMVYEFDFVSNTVSFSKSYGRLSCIDLAGREDASSAWLELIHPEDAPAVGAALSRAMATRQPDYCITYRVNCGNGRYRHVSDQASIVYGLRKRPLRMIGAIRDINEQKEIETSLYRQNETLREIAWIESHEIRRPVASIMALVDLIKDETGNPETQLLLDLLHASAGELDGMIRKINASVSEIASDMAV